MASVLHESATFTILSGHLLVAPDPDIVHKGRIHFPDNMHKKSETGLVVQHQPWGLDEDLTGERVLFEKWSWRELSLGGFTFYLIKEESVFAVLERGKAEENSLQLPIVKAGQNGNS